MRLQIALAALIVCVAGDASAGYLNSGVTCDSVNGNSSTIKFDNRGIISTNTSATREVVMCPFMGGHPNPTNVAIYVYDGNSTVGTSYQFTCGLKIRTTTGTVYSSSELSSSDGYQTLRWQLPFNGSVSGTVASDSAYCHMPASTGTVDSYVIATVKD